MRAYTACPELAANVAQWVQQPLTRAWIEARLDVLCGTCADGALNEAALKTALRCLRTEVFCTVMERDLSGAASVAEVTGAMTDLAEVTIQRALAVLSADLEALFGELRGPNGERLTLGVVGMGKLGGGVNASSDIDLIFIYEDDGETSGGTRSPLTTQEFFTLLGQRLIGALWRKSRRTATCFASICVCARTAIPGRSCAALACSKNIFYAQGREWERYGGSRGVWCRRRRASRRSVS